VEAASLLLTDYNERLQDELKERKKVGAMVSEFLSAQKELLAQACHIGLVTVLFYREGGA
jgi:hypothetical protein